MADRKAVEQQAMLLATSHLESLGFECRDTSATESFDILATEVRHLWAKKGCFGLRFGIAV
ncbi:MAG: hypothetical protein EBX62_06845 [Betaproteobacteria bacterium]|nr:hypothetical protein [Betaproteobacteria bacterium]